MLERVRPGGDSLISVIVPVRNNASGIRELVASLEAQTVGRAAFEIVIGDDGSREGSLAGIPTVDGRIRVERGPPRTSYAARNRAARSARGAVLAFCDSDCVPDPEWLELGVAGLRQADLVAGEVTFVAPEPPTVWSVLTIDMFLDQERNVRLSQAVTANLFVRRALFEELGGFDESLPSGGDYDFVRRGVDAGARLAYARGAVVRHPTLDTRDAFLRKVWNTNRWAAARRARDRERPALGSLAIFVPVLGVALARRHALRPALRLYRPRLLASGADPTTPVEVRALLRLYFVTAYVAGFGRVRGWLDGRGLARGKPWREPCLGTEGAGGTGPGAP